MVSVIGERTSYPRAVKLEIGRLAVNTDFYAVLGYSLAADFGTDGAVLGGGKD